MKRLSSRWMLCLWIYTLLVILWGAWVRISHSGDGCGDHWPLCAGQLVPDFVEKKTWVEYSHRMMSGVYGLLVLLTFVRLRVSESSLVRRLNWGLLIFMISEALLGAALVKGKLVTVDDSVLRLGVMSLHQLNSFILTGTSYLLYLTLKDNRTSLNFRHPLLVAAYVLLPLTGAIAALSTTLFPSQSLLQGILQDFSGQTHLFLRLRVIHPLLASLTAGGFIVWCFRSGRDRLAFEFMTAFAVGILTLVTLSPVYLKLTHLLIAHALWARLLQTLVSLPDSSKR